MPRPEALSVLGSVVLGGAAALFLTFGYQSSSPVIPVPPAPAAAPAEVVPVPRPRPDLPSAKPVPRPKAKGKAKPVQAPQNRAAVTPQVCAQISAGMAFAGRARVMAEGARRGHSPAAVAGAIRECGF